MSTPNYLSIACGFQIIASKPLLSVLNGNAHVLRQGPHSSAFFDDTDNFRVSFSSPILEGIQGCPLLRYTLYHSHPVII